MKPAFLAHALAALLLAFGTPLSGCTSPPLGRATNTYTGDAAGKREEFIGDRDLKAKFVMVNIRTETRDGRLRVQFDLKNTTPGDLAIEWAISWMDQNGFRIDTNPSWCPAIVTGQGFHAIQATAPVPEAKIFSLELRRPTPIK
jgi:uncharacterized protein YcfL